MIAIAICACSPVPSAGGAPSISASESPSSSAAAPEPPASAAVVDAGAAAPRADFHCFSWIHGPQFSTDCYRGPDVCERERLAMKNGARETTPGCEKVAGASCTRVSRPPAPGDSERCFASANACARYRAYVQGNGLTVTPCADH